MVKCQTFWCTCLTHTSSTPIERFPRMILVVARTYRSLVKMRGTPGICNPATEQYLDASPGLLAFREKVVRVPRVLYREVGRNGSQSPQQLSVNGHPCTPRQNFLGKICAYRSWMNLIACKTIFQDISKGVVIIALGNGLGFACPQKILAHACAAACGIS